MGLESRQFNERHKKFCKEYIIDFNAAAAAIKAGYSKKTAKNIGSKLLTKVNLQSYINELIQKRNEKTEITQEKVIKEFAKIAFSSIAHLHNTWIDLKEFESLTDDQKDTIESIKSRKRTIFDKEIKKNVEIEEIHIKLYDKVRALENLGRHTGLYQKDNEQKPAQNESTIIILPSNGREQQD